MSGEGKSDGRVEAAAVATPNAARNDSPCLLRSSAIANEDEAHRACALGVDKLRNDDLPGAMKVLSKAESMKPGITGHHLRVAKILTAGRKQPPRWYEVLDITTAEAADESLIQKTYKTMAMYLHPDKNRGATARANEAFIMAGEAKDLLSDRNKRKNYNFELKKAQQKQAAEEQAASSSQEVSNAPTAETLQAKRQAEAAHREEMAETEATRKAQAAPGKKPGRPHEGEGAAGGGDDTPNKRAKCMQGQQRQEEDRSYKGLKKHRGSSDRYPQIRLNRKRIKDLRPGVYKDEADMARAVDEADVLRGKKPVNFPGEWAEARRAEVLAGNYRYPTLCNMVKKVLEEQRAAQGAAAGAAGPPGAAKVKKALKEVVGEEDEEGAAQGAASPPARPKRERAAAVHFDPTPAIREHKEKDPPPKGADVEGGVALEDGAGGGDEPLNKRAKGTAAPREQPSKNKGKGAGGAPPPDARAGGPPGKNKVKGAAAPSGAGAASGGSGYNGRAPKRAMTEGGEGGTASTSDSAEAKKTNGNNKTANAPPKKKKTAEEAKWVALLEKYVKELGDKGLRREEVPGDGNCLFHSLADQVGGDHTELRQKIVTYMTSNEKDFEGFVEDDEGWETYIKRMAKDGEWGGNMEVVAASKLLERNIVIHAPDGLRRAATAHVEGWRFVHLSYEVGAAGEGTPHYNSIRQKADRGKGPAKAITEEAAAKEAAVPEAAAEEEADAAAASEEAAAEEAADAAAEAARSEDKGKGAGGACGPTGTNKGKGTASEPIGENETRKNAIAKDGPWGTFFDVLPQEYILRNAPAQPPRPGEERGFFSHPTPQKYRILNPDADLVPSQAFVFARLPVVTGAGGAGGEAAGGGDSATASSLGPYRGHHLEAAGGIVGRVHRE